jgi:hypothetical protein
MRRRQFSVAVFAGDRARDLVGVFTVVALNDGDAIQQAWDYIKDNWAENPAPFEYHALRARATTRRRRKKR